MCRRTSAVAVRPEVSSPPGVPWMQCRHQSPLSAIQWIVAKPQRPVPAHGIQVESYALPTCTMYLKKYVVLWANINNLLAEQKNQSASVTLSPTLWYIQGDSAWHLGFVIKKSYLLWNNPNTSEWDLCKFQVLYCIRFLWLTIYLTIINWINIVAFFSFYLYSIQVKVTQ